MIISCHFTTRDLHSDYAIVYRLTVVINRGRAEEVKDVVSVQMCVGKQGVQSFIYKH